MLYVQGVKYRFSLSHNFRNFTGFLYGYGCIKRDKTDRIASIMMKFLTLVVKILLEHKIDEHLSFW